MVNSSANIKPCHSKYTYYIHHSAYLQPSSVPSNTTYSLQPNHTVIQINTYILWSSWLLGWIYLFFNFKTSAIFFFNMIFFSSCIRHEKDFKKINDVSKLWTFLPNLYRFCENYVILRTKMLGSTYELLETLINSKSETHQGIIKT